ncbi:MAG: LemA family protein [Nanoarchaeota archaeon]
MERKKNKQPSNKLIVLGGILIFVLFVALYIGGTYNSFVALDENVNNAWGNVQTAYQRRTDLIPNLVATVKAYSDYEGEVLTEITQARSSIGNAKTPGELEAADSELNSALAKLLVVVENYPNLKANENYLDLQVQLEGTENRIKVERDVYNKGVRQFNVKARRFPSNVFANMFGFEQKQYFEADEGSNEAPDVGKLLT